MNKSVLLDTCFLICLVDSARQNHESAKGYFKYFLEEEYDIYLSTIVASEYNCKDSIRNLPLNKFKILPFNISHADKISTTFNELKTEDATRIQVKDDYKISCQVEYSNIQYFITDDAPIAKKLNALKEEGKISFSTIHLGTDYKNTFQLQTELPF